MSTQQIQLFDITDFEESNEELDLTSYDFVIVAFSGGKDCQASLLALLEAGVPRERIELWHHCVDGFENPEPLFDWPVTEDYCRKFAESFGLRLFFSWKDGGIEGEMLRENSFTRPTYFQTPEGLVKSGGESGKRSTRRKFPQLSASLNTRWCSAYAKIDPASKAITGQQRFTHKRTLFVTGERAQESAARSRYKTFEPHRADRRFGRLNRHVDHYRPVHGWSEEEVWAIIKRWRVNSHPAYKLGWGRLSCQKCIFGSDRQWKSVQTIDYRGFERIAAYEEEFGVTIHRTKSVRQRIVGVTPYETLTDELVQMAMTREYLAPIFVENWELPAGAFGESAGPS